MISYLSEINILFMFLHKHMTLSGVCEKNENLSGKLIFNIVYRNEFLISWKSAIHFIQETISFVDF